jgi:large subunit ribosomal protein L32e
MAEKGKAKETKEETVKTEKVAKSVAQPKAEAKKVEAKKYIPYVKKENKKKSDEAYALMKKLNSKKHHPVFRGRFGKKNIRRKSIAKWDKWRLPHGIDLDKGRNHGRQPRIGYRSTKEIRFVHPSGYKEVLVCNMNDIAKIDNKTQAARIGATVGKRKRNEIVTEANKKGIWVLN